MPIDLDAHDATPTPPVERTWTSKDAILYALGVGAGGIDPLGAELSLTTENSANVAQQVLPTFAVIAGDWDRRVLALEPAELARCVHGEQAITLYGEIPVTGTARVTSRIAAIYDKGSGALIVVEAEATNVSTGNPLCTSRSSIFVRGAGGFGGHRGPSGTSTAPLRHADAVVTYKTRPDQALLYRLSGDRNPLHSDPVHARSSGFPSPILHGLCTYGFAGRALLHTLCGSDPARFISMEGRFTRPAFPGQSLTVHMWVRGGEAIFTTTVDDGGTVIDHGRFTFTT
jgi:acyl dehydratase